MERQLPRAEALAVVELIYGSDNWLMSPTDDGCFKGKDEAIAYVEATPNAPLRICACRVEDDYCESIEISLTEDGEFYLDGSEAMRTLDIYAETLADVVASATYLFSDIIHGMSYQGKPMTMQSYLNPTKS